MLIPTVSRHLFGTSGIRGVVNEDLTPDFCRQIAQALGSTLPPASRVCLATDTRVSREIIKAAVVSGLLSSGIDVADLGILPTPALALLTRELGFSTGIMITASHNPPQFNGIKLFNGNSLGYSRAQEAEVERIYFDRGFRTGGRGILEKSYDMKQGYFSFIKEKLPLPKPPRRLKLVIDPGNGAAAGFVTDLFSEMGLDVTPLNDEPDGLFPGRNPEPKEDTLTGTIDFLKQQNADLAICFDGDADRVVFCDREGFLGFNEMIAFISRQIINETGRKIIATTVETGIFLDLAVKDLGGEVVRGKVGDINVAYLAREIDAALGVEAVGVYIIPEVGYYPDSIFATLILLSSIKDASEIRQFFRALPRLFFSKSKVACPNQAKEAVMAQMKQKSPLFAASHVNDLDGLRFEFADSWMLIRASGTEPAIRVVAESTSSPKTESLLRQGTRVVQDLVKEAGQ